MSEARVYLQQIVSKWQQESQRDSRDGYPYQNLLDELLFHSDLRFKDYEQFKGEGEFPVRLKKWINNVVEDREKKVLFKLLRWITFIDHLQMLSLCRDAYRRILIPWLASGTFSVDDLVAPDYEEKVIENLRQFSLLSITESFGFSDFLHVNDLAGLAKPTILGEKKSQVKGQMPSREAKIKGVIIFEDFVGTGKQATSIIEEVRAHADPNWKIIFLPLIVLDRGLEHLQNKLTPIDVAVKPVLIIQQADCLLPEAQEEEPSEFAHIRTLVKRTSKRVLEPFGPHDDPPSDPFGYKGSGLLLVTCHNAPNNTLPLIHHRAPDWSPLFRRIHHSKDHLR